MVLLFGKLLFGCYLYVLRLNCVFGLQSLWPLLKSFCTLVPNPYTFLLFQKGHFSPYLHSVSKGLSHHLINENCQSNKQNSCLFIKLGTEFLNAKSTETIPNSQFKLGRDFFFFFSQQLKTSQPHKGFIFFSPFSTWLSRSNLKECRMKLNKYPASHLLSCIK